MPYIMFVFANSDFVIFVDRELLAKALISFYLQISYLFIGYLFLNLIAGELVLHKGCGDHCYHVDYGKPVQHVLAVGLQKVLHICVKENDAEKKATEGADGAVDNAGEVVGYEGHDQDKEPEGVHADCPVNLSYEVDKENCAYAKRTSYAGEYMLFSFSGNVGQNAEEKGNADISNLAVVVTASRNKGGQKAVGNKAKQQNVCGSALLFLNIFGIFEFDELRKAVTKFTVEVKKRKFDVHRVMPPNELRQYHDIMISLNTVYLEGDMSRILLIYAAVIFIAGVVLFTYATLKKEKEVEEPETNTWMRILAAILVIMAAVCLFVSCNMN